MTCSSRNIAKLFDQLSNLRYNRRTDCKGARTIRTRIRALGLRLRLIASILIFGILVSSNSPLTPLSALAFDAPAAQNHIAQPAPLMPAGRLIVSAQADGMWNIFAVDPNGSAWQKIAVNAAPARDPAISPDGKTIAFRSHRDGNWEIYTMAANGGVPTRLTRGTLYSGAPVWSPDGKRIAYESFARGGLDIWTMNADGSQPTNLTEDAKAYDYAPAWSPDGKWITFTSWRTGTQQVFLVAADCASACQATNLSQNKFDDQASAWSPDGKKLAFVSDRDGQRAIYLADFSPLGLKNAQRLTFSGWDDQPAWSPDGNWIAFVSVRPTRQPLYIVSANGGVPQLVENGPLVASSVTWANDALATAGDTANDASAALFKATPDLAAPNSGHPFDARRITSTKLDPGINKLNSQVADSFVALQLRVKQDVGYDFLNTLADMMRPVDYKCDITCDTLSWHKAGRAWDSRLDYTDAKGIGGLEIVREDQQGETFWRMYLRAAVQDGTMGEPLKDAPWDFSYRARWVIAPGEGGIKKTVPNGFYVDFTELAREYGWERISSQNSEAFDWRTNKIGAEYWHYQNSLGLNWYQAMREIYSESDLKSLVDWNALATSGGYDADILYLKGIPLPAKAWRWSVLAP